MLSPVKGEEDDEDKRNASVTQERQRTLERLRSLKQVRTPVCSHLTYDRIGHVTDLIMLTPHTVLSRPGDTEVQPAASESASRPEESGTAAQHSGSQCSDRRHHGSPRALCSSSAWRLRQRVFTYSWTRKSRLLAPLPVAASHLSLPVYSFAPSSTSTSTPTSPPSSTSSSLRRAAAAWGEGDGQPSAVPYHRVGIFLSALGSVLPSILRQQSAADGEEEAEEDGLAGLVAVEERWGGDSHFLLYKRLQFWFIWWHLSLVIGTRILHIPECKAANSRRAATLSEI